MADRERPPWPKLIDAYRPKLKVKVIDPRWQDVLDLSLQRQKKKQFEECRRSSAGVRDVGRCPSLKGCRHYGGGARKAPMAASDPILFKFPNVLTPRESQELVSVDEAYGFHKPEGRWYSYGGEVKNGPSFYKPNFCYPYSRTSACNAQYFTHGCLAEKLWARGLSTIFEDIRIEGWEEVPAVGLVGPYQISRYEKGEFFEPRAIGNGTYIGAWPCKQGICPGDRKWAKEQPSFPRVSFEGYDILIYLTGESEKESVDISGSTHGSSVGMVADSPVVGGETVFYSDRSNGKTPVAEIAPVAGMAVCYLRGQCPVHEDKPVKQGVKYVMQLSVKFSNEI